MAARRLVAGFGDLPRRARGVGGDDRLDAELADHLAALSERMHVALDGLDVLERRALHREQLVAHRHEVLGDDVQPRMRHQVMDVGDPSRDRVLDRDHAEIGLAGRDRREGVLERRAGQGLGVRIDLADREVRIRPRLALECDFLGIGHGRSGTRTPDPRQRCPRKQLARPLQVLRRIDAERHAVDNGDVDPHAGFERAQLLELLAQFERRGRQRDEALQRGAAVGIEPDVVIERPVARRRGRAREIQRPQPLRRNRRADDLHHVRIGRAPRRARSRPPACAMSTAGSASGATAARMSAASIVGRSPCTFSTMLQRAFRIGARQRLENPVRARDVVGAGHDGAPAGLLDAGEDGLGIGRDHHRAGPGGLARAAARARSSACRAMSASGLPGSRVEAIRAGMMVRTSWSAIGFLNSAVGSMCRTGRNPLKSDVGLAGYTGCQKPGNRVIPSARRTVAAAFPCRVWSLDAMDSFELNKIMGAILGTCLGSPVAEHRGQCDLPSRDSRPSRATRSSCPRSPQRDQKGAPAQQDPPIEQLLASADVGARRGVPQQVHRLPHLRQGRPQPGRPQSLRRDRPREGHRSPASTIRPPSRKR